VKTAKASLRQLNFVPMKDFSTRLVLNARISSQNSGFGDGFLLSVLKSDETQVDRGLSVATSIEGVPGVVQVSTPQNFFYLLLTFSKLQR